MNGVEKRMKNLLPLNTRSKEKKLEIQKKGGKASVEKRRSNAQKKVEREAMLKLMKDFLYSMVSEGELLQFLEQSGVKDEKNKTYAMVLIVSTIKKAIEDGDFDILLKLMELFGEIGEKSNSEEDKAFNNLIEAVKNVRKSKRKTT